MPKPVRKTVEYIEQDRVNATTGENHGPHVFRRVTKDLENGVVVTVSEIPVCPSEEFFELHPEVEVMGRSRGRVRSPAQFTVRELQARLPNETDVGTLARMRRMEVEGQNRASAVRLLDDRIDELLGRTESEDDSKGEGEDGTE